MQIETVVGPQFGGQGSVTKSRASGDGSLVTMDGHARYQEAVYRGNVYTAFDGAGRTTPGGLSASPVTVTLYNPVNSGVNCVLWYASYLTLVAPAAAQAIWLGINNAQGQAATTGTALNPINANGNPVSGKVKAFTAATLPAAPSIWCDLGTVLTGAITVASSVPPLAKWLDGCLQLPPGCAVSFQASTVGGTNGAIGGYIYEEVPLIFG